MKKDKVTLPEGITQEMIDQFKGQHDTVKLVELSRDEDGSEKLAVLMTRPSRFAIGEFEKQVERNPNRAKTILVKAALLTHEEEVLGNDFLFYSAFDAAANLMPISKAIIKNC